MPLFQSSAAAALKSALGRYGAGAATRLGPATGGAFRFLSFTGERPLRTMAAYTGLGLGLGSIYGVSSYGAGSLFRDRYYTGLSYRGGAPPMAADIEMVRDQGYQMGRNVGHNHLSTQGLTLALHDTYGG